MFKNPRIKTHSVMGHATRGEICNFITKILGLPISHRTIDRRLTELLRMGFIEKVTRGVYRITDKGKEEAAVFDVGLRLRYEIMYGVKGKVNVVINIGSKDDVNILIRLTGQVAKLVISALESRLGTLPRGEPFEALMQSELQPLYELIGLTTLVYLLSLHDTMTDLVRKRMSNLEEVYTYFKEVLDDILKQSREHTLMEKNNTEAEN